MGKINNLIGGLKSDLKGKTSRQTFTLYSSQIVALLLGIITGMINTRTLGPAGYGILSFYFTVTSFTVLFFRFGFFSSAGLLLAQAKEERKERELTGTAIIAALFIGLSYSVFILIFSFFVDGIFHTNVGWILRYTSFLLIAMPFTFLIPQVGRGTNKIAKMSLFKVIPKIVYILGALILLKVVQIQPAHFILLYIISTIIAVVSVLYLFNPLFNNIRENLKIIWQKNKEYGFHLYLGQIADQSTYKLDKVFITYFVNTTQLGFYALAMTITAPMVGLSQALSISLFKGFVDRDRIPKKVIYYNFLWLAACVIGLVIFGRLIVVTLFTDKFLPAVRLILPLALAGFFQGMYQPYGMFFESKGKGKYIRNNSIITSAVNLLGNIILIPLWGTMGAAVASALGNLTHLSIYLYYYYYKKVLFKIQNGTQ